MGYAPKYVDWSSENRSQLIRIPKAVGVSPRIELRSADAACNPYIAFKLILAAGIEGISSGDCSIMDSTMKVGHTPADFERLPDSLEEAVFIAENSDFVKRSLPDEVRTSILSHLRTQIQEYNLAKDKSEFEDKAYFMYT
jgi:glutamine synthetase